MNRAIKRILFSTPIRNCNRSKSNGNELIKHSWEHNSSTSPYDMESYLEYQNGSNFYLIISLLHY